MRVTVVGIGGAGCNFAHRFRATDIPGLSRLIFIDTDETSLARTTSTTAVPGDISRTYLQIGTGYSHHPEDSFDDIMDRVDSAILATASRLVTSLAG